MAVQLALGGGLLAILQEAPEQLDNLATRIAKALSKLKAHLKTFDWSDIQIDDFAKKVENWTDTDIDRLLDDLGTADKEIWEEFRDGNLSLEVTKVLDANKILRRTQGLLGNLTFIETQLKDLNAGLTMDDIKAFYN